jgi:hypothetical protein
LDEQIVKKFSTAEVREKLDESIDAALLWLEDNEGANSPSIFTNKLAELKALSDDIFFRIKEARLRPDALADLKSTIQSKNTKLIAGKLS